MIKNFLSMPGPMKIIFLSAFLSPMLISINMSMQLQALDAQDYSLYEKTMILISSVPAFLSSIFALLRAPISRALIPASFFIACSPLLFDEAVDFYLTITFSSAITILLYFYFFMNKEISYYFGKKKGDSNLN